MEAAPSRHSRNDFVLRACLIMNPHPVEAPPPFARHHRLCKRLVGVGACREPGGGGRAAFAAARWPSFGLNCSVYYPCGISNYLFLLDRPLARMTLISLAARLHTFNWCVTSRQLRPLSLSLFLSLSLSLSLSLYLSLFALHVAYSTTRSHNAV